MVQPLYKKYKYEDKYLLTQFRIFISKLLTVCLPVEEKKN